METSTLASHSDRILFLDVDGVLNNSTQEEQLSKFNINNLKNLVTTLNLKIVISSDWRKNPTNLTKLKSELSLHGIEIHATTAITREKRKLEIKQWVNEHTFPDKHHLFIVLDDMPACECDPNLNNCLFFQTDHRLGLTEDDVDTIISRATHGTRFNSNQLHSAAGFLTRS